MHNIAVFHYHLLPAGVTKVITLAVSALLTENPGEYNFTLVCGRAEHIDEVLESIRSDLPSSQAGKVTGVVLPRLDYLKQQSVPPSWEEIAEELEQRFSNMIWWIHNHHLGKNWPFTKAVNTIARKGKQHIILQIHDFPECARYDNLSTLKTNISESLYPVGNNVRYAVINSRDRTFLTEAGIPGEHVFLLHNPIKHTKGSSGILTKQNVRENVESSFAEDFPAYVPGAPWMLYPVRTIRRKNVLEAGLLSRALECDANLMVTLEGVSAQEQGYSELVQKAFQEGLIPGMWGIGNRLEEAEVDFSSFAAAADLIMSSSVQEGFGYLFLEALSWQKALAARYLDIMDGLRPYYKDYPHLLYTSLDVPISPGEAAALRTMYMQELKKIRDYLSKAGEEQLQQQVSGLGESGTVDFSFLSGNMQFACLQKLTSDELLSEIRTLNTAVLKEIEGLFSENIPKERAEESLELFGFAHFTETFAGIIDSLQNPRREEYRDTDYKDVGDRLVTRFADLRYFRLLYQNTP